MDYYEDLCQEGDHVMELVGDHWETLEPDMYECSICGYTEIGDKESE